jgi:hypothetical protein
MNIRSILLATLLLPLVPPSALAVSHSDKPVIAVTAQADFAALEGQASRSVRTVEAQSVSAAPARAEPAQAEPNALAIGGIALFAIFLAGRRSERPGVFRHDQH